MEVLTELFGCALAFNKGDESYTIFFADGTVRDFGTTIKFDKHTAEKIFLVEMDIYLEVRYEKQLPGLTGSGFADRA